MCIMSMLSTHTVAALKNQQNNLDTYVRTYSTIGTSGTAGTTVTASTTSTSGTSGTAGTSDSNGTSDTVGNSGTTGCYCWYYIVKNGIPF